MTPISGSFINFPFSINIETAGASQKYAQLWVICFQDRTDSCRFIDFMKGWTFY